MHVKKGDTVMVIAGKDKGAVGKVIAAGDEGHETHRHGTIGRRQEPVADVRPGQGPQAK